jgi:catechol 2,3-dioxygenase-like lactoylglutathione lyase family enzyme
MISSSPPMSAPQNDEVAIERFGLYVIAEDLDRSVPFYERLFGKPPQVRTPGDGRFRCSGRSLRDCVEADLFANSKRGDNVAPDIKVRDIHGLFDRVKAFAPESLRSEAVFEEGPFKFFKVVDPDGNLVEFFSVSAPKQ